ncbi:MULTISPECIES: GNAT family N-acetyltransferase [Enterococcus]|uniref:GNAT family N-acetyltransferase n=1 Tax=Candidatus Enterococcus murrayae TaxID=2815321 RepID=A0ABS3HJZ9_9ENTE|nr:GNAT family N-acetyltransferase [Enterococcus sp. MJM16]MBO0453792.1 GNAT family N-acetyltransferase [Enterococcus sp. MJM16]
MEGKIRLCTLEDLTKLREISIETFSDTFALDNNPADLQEYLSNAYGLDELEKEMQNPESRFFFVYLTDELAGYLKLNTGIAQTETLAKNGLEVERIYIRKSFKRHGLGRQLIDYALELACKERRDSIWLGVWEKNVNALRFYRTFGFEKVGAHDFTVGKDKQTDLIMMKPLL